jgi:quinol-cytochrome oxidoreductase complex cytochrome b subunit
MSLKTWLDDRLGLGALAKFNREQLHKPVPPHASHYAFTLGTAALVLFMTQVGSGILLALNYSCSMDQAYRSVERITFEIPAGWLIRSFHAWGAHLMVIVVLLHLVRVFWYGGYKKPRELTWLFGCGLLFLTLTFGFTGYLLPMDQVSYWGTVVATKSFMELPGLGDRVGQTILGGDTVSDATLSRFYIIHVLLLPAGLAGLVALHLYLVRRLGISTRESVTVETQRGYASIMQQEGVPFSKHLFREVTTVIVVLSAAVTLAVLFPFELGEKANPANTPEGVKPEWYFLPVYQVLKYFPKLVGILLVNAGIAILVFLPFFDRNPERLPDRRKLLLSAAAAGLLVTLALGALGYVSERRFGSVKFDILGVPHRAAEAGKAAEGRP